MLQQLKQRYFITGVLGRGGMGSVYQAKDVQLGNRLVAIKEMTQRGLNTPEIAAASKAFRQEANMLAALQHPNLPSIHDHFEENDRWYLVMEYIEGKTLDEYLASGNGKLPLKEVLAIGIQLCAVLEYLHLRPQPIIFRDLKPSNIMLAPDGHLYLIDFGIARNFKPEQTKDTNRAYTTGYAAPEQYFNETQTSPQSDIYSMGVTLYQLLTGHHPLKNRPTIFDFPTLKLPESPALQILITQMIEKDQQRRPPNVTVIKRELQRLIAPQTEPPIGQAHRANRSDNASSLTTNRPLPSAVTPGQFTQRRTATFRGQQLKPSIVIATLILLLSIIGGTWFLASSVYSHNQNSATSSSNNSANGSFTQPTAPPQNPTPTSTPTPSPTPNNQPNGSTPLNYSPSIRDTDARNMVITYYDNKGVWAGQYVLEQIDTMSYGVQNGNSFIACVAYTFALPSTPTTPAGQDRRTYTFQVVNGTWQVVAMGDNQSC